MSAGKIYAGWRRREGCNVTVDGSNLPLCLSIRNHSPTGFEWGYGGSGPAQLALAILVSLIGEENALPLYQHFKWEVIAHLPERGWQLSEAEIKQWVSHKRESAA